MKILGEKVRLYRKHKGLSQKDLANGICTQVTISLIEKKNKIPSMQIMLQLCNRLGIRLEDIIIESDDQLYQTFKEIDSLIQHQEYVRAETIFNKIKVKQLRDNSDKKRYYYYLGELQLRNHDAPDEAIFNFGLLLNQFARNTKDIYSTLATLGTGLAYGKKGEFDKARVYVSQAVAALEDQNNSDHDNLDAIISGYADAAELYQQVGIRDEALRLIDTALEMCTENQTMFLLDVLYAAKAANQFELGEKDSAKENYYIAYSLSIVNKDEKLKTEIQEQFRSLNIPPLAI